MATKILLLSVFLPFAAQAQSYDTVMVHWFSTHTQADSAIEKINHALGIPHDAHSLTTTYCTARYDSTGAMWYIEADASTAESLGKAPQYFLKPKEIPVKP